MSNLKKIIGVVLAFAMILSMASIASFAAGEAYTVSVVAADTTLAPGESTTVSVYVTANYYVSGMSIPVFFDNDNVTVDATPVYIMDGGNVSNEASPAAEKVFSKSGYTYGEDGLVLFTYVAEVGDELSTYNNVKVLEFTVTANADATGSVAFECTTGSKKDASSNTTGALYVLKNQNQEEDDDGKVYLDSVAEVVSTATLVNNANITFAATAAGDPELVLTETGEDYGTIIRNDLCADYDGCVAGIDVIEGEAIEDYVTVINGSMEVVENDQGVISTGATILVKDSSDNVVATYVFICFGDVNGDGAIDGSDAGDVEAHDAWMDGCVIDEDTPAYYAADVNGDGSVDGSDAGDIEAHDAWYVLLDSQADMAANFNAAW